MQDELIAARDALHEQATHDTLTGLMNRGATVPVLMRELARSARECRSLSVVLTDVDHFKKINYGYGHLAGDAVLQEIASRMTRCVRSYDTVARYGGEEFLMIVPTATEDAAFRLAERIRRTIESAPVRAAAGEIPVTASFGVASWDGSGSLDATNLLRLADAALYRAKSMGRNCVERASRLREPVSPVPSPVS